MTTKSLMGKGGKGKIKKEERGMMNKVILKARGFSFNGWDLWFLATIAVTLVYAITLLTVDIAGHEILPHHRYAISILALLTMVSWAFSSSKRLS